MSDYFLISRDFVNHEWYKNTVATVLFFHLLLMTNEHGQTVSNPALLAKELKIDEIKIKRAIARLIESEDISAEYKPGDKMFTYTLTNFDQFCERGE